MESLIALNCALKAQASGGGVTTSLMWPEVKLEYRCNESHSAFDIALNANSGKPNSSFFSCCSVVFSSSEDSSFCSTSMVLFEEYNSLTRFTANEVMTIKAMQAMKKFNVLWNARTIDWLLNPFSGDLVQICSLFST